ncbi:MAG: DUF4166 domain-containing protein [Alphaproteobacteria bacterium]|nr:DUF4166 domain-containing protein [Alphaproteobacteria bacterium]MBV9371627.1 DUF4166 domain-containing protein [Alphaproteobacteria bacterium]MBV9901030.1 DUF4166 domain-containing protein [Alphaproteobacteria bacterium]
MEGRRNAAGSLPFPARAAPAAAAVADLRFRALAGAAAWESLPAAVRARFERHVGPGATILYAGEVVECRMSRAGRLLSQLARLIGAPLPLSRDTGVPAAVSVTEDARGGGQLWTRLYGRRRGFPQVIHSAKRFAGATGLEEYVGCGVGIALRLQVEGEALHFLSDHYFLKLRGIRMRLPAWLAPGRMRVSHVDRGEGRFAFVPALEHPMLGELIRQTILFADEPLADRGCRG